MLRLPCCLFALSLALATPALARNHALSMPPLPAGAYPVACSNLAQDEALLARLGGTPADYWEGNPDGGSGRYLTQLLAEPSAALQFNLAIPDDRGLYEHFAGDQLPLVLLVCYPTSPENNRADFRLPDGQWLPRMERAGDGPIFPGVGGRLPLVVYSHGLGGSPVSDDYLSTIKRIASHGYIVMAPFHGDARVVRIRIDSLSDLVYLVRNFDRYTELQALRPLGLKQALDFLLTHPVYSRQIDPEKIGGFGASLGGEALMLAMGAHLTDSYSSLSARATAQDARIKAAVGYVPYAGQSFLPAFGNDQRGARFVSRPYLALAGTADTTAPLSLAQQAINQLQGSRYLIALQDIPHNYQESYADDVFSWALTFLDAHVKGDLRALDRLVRTHSVAGGLSDAVRVDFTAPTADTDGQVLVAEFFNFRTGHYINAIGSAEIDLVNANASHGWVRTGQDFKAWLNGPAAPITGLPACRFYNGNGGGLLTGRDTLFLTVQVPECVFGKTLPGWGNLGTPVMLALPVGGVCPSGTIAVLRAYNNAIGEATNHRFFTSNESNETMQRAGWKAEGAQFCAPL